MSLGKANPIAPAAKADCKTQRDCDYALYCERILIETLLGVSSLPSSAARDDRIRNTEAAARQTKVLQTLIWQKGGTGRLHMHRATALLDKPGFRQRASNLAGSLLPGARVALRFMRR